MCWVSDHSDDKAIILIQPIQAENSWAGSALEEYNWTTKQMHGLISKDNSHCSLMALPYSALRGPLSSWRGSFPNF